MNPLRLTLLAGIAAVALSAAFPSSVLAQIPSGANRSGGAPLGPVVQPHDNTERKQAAPPAIPGAQSSREAAPPDRPPQDMEPTEALFDAINRGDMGSARDALNRGADISGKSVLGMTPTELSVDLGRNDITFLLLSMRGSSGDAALPPPTPASAHPAMPQGVRRGRGAVATAASASQPRGDTFADPDPTPSRSGARSPGSRTAAGAAQQAPVRPSAPPTLARQFAGDGGTPIPQMGFLGFGGSK